MQEIYIYFYKNMWLSEDEHYELLRMGLGYFSGNMYCICIEAKTWKDGHAQLTKKLGDLLGKMQFVDSTQAVVEDIIRVG